MTTRSPYLSRESREEMERAEARQTRVVWTIVGVAVAGCTAVSFGVGWLAGMLSAPWSWRW